MKTELRNFTRFDPCAVSSRLLRGLWRRLTWRIVGRDTNQTFLFSE